MGVLGPVEEQPVFLTLESLQPQELTLGGFPVTSTCMLEHAHPISNK